MTIAVTMAKEHEEILDTVQSLLAQRAWLDTRELEGRSDDADKERITLLQERLRMTLRKAKSRNIQRDLVAEAVQNGISEGRLGTKVTASWHQLTPVPMDEMEAVSAPVVETSAVKKTTPKVSQAELDERRRTRLAILTLPVFDQVTETYVDYARMRNENGPKGKEFGVLRKKLVNEITELQEKGHSKSQVVSAVKHRLGERSLPRHHVAVVSYLVDEALRNQKLEMKAAEKKAARDAAEKALMESPGVKKSKAKKEEALPPIAPPAAAPARKWQDLASLMSDIPGTKIQGTKKPVGRPPNTPPVFSCPGGVATTIKSLSDDERRTYRPLFEAYETMRRVNRATDGIGPRYEAAVAVYNSQLDRIAKVTGHDKGYLSGLAVDNLMLQRKSSEQSFKR